jgi:hypothetical protein
MRFDAMFISSVLSLAIMTAAAPLQAQSAAPHGAQSSGEDAGRANPSNQVQATGCLRRGNDGGYYLTDHSGQTWALSSTTVDLSQHVMHSVSITGRPTKPQPGETQSSNGNPSLPMEVVSLTVLSRSCTR